MSDEICRICLEDCGHEPDCPEGMVEDLQSDLDQLQAENDSLAAEIEQLTKDRDEARAAKAKWIMQHGIATSEIGQLQRYKEFAMKCAAVNNHAGWQGAYFREAQALFLPTKDGDELPPLQKMPPVAGKLREARRMSLPPGLDETGKDDEHSEPLVRNCKEHGKKWRLSNGACAMCTVQKVLATEKDS